MEVHHSGKTLCYNIFLAIIFMDFFSESNLTTLSNNHMDNGHGFYFLVPSGEILLALHT
jgi:hypothetical protein